MGLEEFREALWIDSGPIQQMPPAVGETAGGLFETSERQKGATCFQLTTGDHGNKRYPGTIGNRRVAEMGPGHQAAIQFHHGINVTVSHLGEQGGHGQPFLPGNFFFVDGDHSGDAILGQYRYNLRKIDAQALDGVRGGYAIGGPSTTLVDRVLKGFILGFPPFSQFSQLPGGILSRYIQIVLFLEFGVVAILPGIVFFHG
jgi:hypothetical protein